jgi:fibronectin-binding autotransporter adhesin
VRRPTFPLPALLAGLLLVSSTITCSESPAGPKGGLRAIVGLSPTFSKAATDIYRNLVSFELAVNNVRVRLQRANGDIALDTTAAVSAGQTEIVLELSVELESTQEILDALIELRDGEQVLFSGTQTITARSGFPTAAPPPIELEYTGPGATAVSLDVEPDTTITAMGSLIMRPIARDANNQLVTNLDLNWSVSDPTIGTVNGAGMFTSSGPRGSTVITAILPTGVSGSATVTVVAPPTAVVLISGGDQTGIAGAALAQPIVVEVRASDGLPVAGHPVTFLALTGGGSVSPTSAVTGANGRASTTLTLGPTPGLNMVRVTATGIDPIGVAATGTVGPAASIAATAPVALAIADTAGANVATPSLPSVVVRDANGNVVPGVQVKFRRHGGAGATINAQPDTLVLATTAANGAAAVTGRRLQTVPGLDTVLVTAAGVNDTLRFVATVSHASATQLQFLQQPTNAIAGATITPAVTVEVRDQFGNRVTTGTNATKTVALSLSGATLSGTTSAAAVAGVATFDNLSVQPAGSNYQLLATASPLVSANSAAFTIASSVSTVTWTNAAGGNWSTGANWSSGVAPSTTNNVVIDLAGTYTVTLDVNATVASLTLGGTSGTQTLAMASRTLTINGASSITTNGILSLTTSNVTGSGTLTSLGLVITHGTSALNAPIAIAASGTLLVRGQNSGSTAALTVANGFTNSGLIELTSADLGFSSSLTVTTGTLTNAAGATIRSAVGAGGTRTLAAQLANQGTLDVDQALTLAKADADHLNNGAIDLTGAANLTVTQTGTTPSFTNTGTVTLVANRDFTLTGGTVDLSSGTVSGAATSTLVVSGASLAFSTATVTIPMTLTTTTIVGGSVSIPTGQTLVLLGGGLSDPVIVQAGGTLLTHGTVSLTGSLSLPAATSTLRIRGQNNGSTAALTVANGFTNNGLIELTSADLGFSSSLTVTSGTLTNAAGATIRPAVGAGGTRTLAAQLDNQGTLDVDQPLTLAKAGADHVNSGAIDLTVANLTVTQTGTTPSFANTGTVTLAANRDFTLTGGTVDFSAGTVSGTLTSTLVVSGASLAFSTTTVTIPMTLTTTSIIGGSVTIPSGQTLILLGGGLSDPVTVQAGGTLLTHGTVSLTGAVSLPTATSTLRVRGQNNGSTAALTVANGFTNNGLIELTSADLGYGASLTVTAGTLINASGATIRPAVGAGGTRTLAAQLDNQAGATLDVDQPLTLAKVEADHTNGGAIDLTVANLTVTQTGTTPSFTNTGTVTLAANRDFTLTGGTVDFSAGTVSGTLTSTLFVSGASLAFSTTTVTIPMTLTTTTIAGGSVTIATGQTLTLLNGGLSDPVTIQSGGTLLTHGTVSLIGAMSTTAGGTLRVRGQNNGSTASLTIASGFANNGLIELTSADLGYGASLTVTAGTLTNASGGVIRAAVGAGGTRTLAAQLDNQGSGLLDVDQGLTLAKADADHTNGGTIDLQATANMTVTQTGTTPSFTNTGSVLLGAGRDLTVTGGTLDLSAGTVSGTVTSTLFVSGASLAFTPSTVTIPMTLTTTTIVGGAVTISSAQTLTLLNGGLSDPVTIQSGGTLLTHGTVSLTGAMTLQSGGTLRVRGQNNGSTATTTIANGFTNSGTIELTSAELGYGATLAVTTGTLANNFGATITLAPGAGGTRTLAAELSNNGIVNVNQPLTINKPDAAHYNSNAINVNADLTVTQSGTAPSFGNGLVGSIVLATGRTLTFNGGAVNLTGSSTINGPQSATVVMTGSVLQFTPLNVTVPLTLTNTTFLGGSLTIGSSQTVTLLSGGIASTDAVTLLSGGTLNTHGTVAFNGALSVQSGGVLNVIGSNLGSTASLNLANGFTNSGLITLTSVDLGYSASLNVGGGGTLTNASGATLQSTNGAGGTRTIGANVSNGGAIRPGGTGGQVGTLTINGNYTQIAGGFLYIDIASNTSSDVLAISGTAALAGTINMAPISPYTIASGPQWTAMTYASRTGTVSVTAPCAAFATYNSTSLQLTQSC